MGFTEQKKKNIMTIFTASNTDCELSQGRGCVFMCVCVLHFVCVNVCHRRGGG